MKYVYLLGLSALMLASCVPAPETRLDDFWAKAAEAGMYFPRLAAAEKKAPKHLPVPTEAWLAGAKAWSKDLETAFADIDSSLLPEPRKQEYSKARNALRNLQHEVALLHSDVSAYNLYFWLKHLDLLKGKPEALNETLQKAPEYYRLAGEALRDLNPATVATAVKEHTPFILWLAKQPGDAAQEARLAAKSYLAACESRAAYILRNGKRVFQ